MEVVGCIGQKAEGYGRAGTQFHDLLSPILPVVFCDSDEHINQMCGYNWKSQPFRSVDRSTIAGDLVFACVDRNRLVALDKWSGELLWQADDPFEPMTFHFYQNHVYFMDMGGNLRCYEWENEYISPNRPSDPEVAWICPERTSL